MADIHRMDNYFHNKQIAGIDNGEMLSSILKSWTQTAVGLNKGQASTKRHTIIQGPPGTSKTYTVNEAIVASGIHTINFHGVASMSAFVMRMASELHLNPGVDKIVWIDDCDSFFVDKIAMNIMKGVLDEDRNVLAYNVNLSNQISGLRKNGNVGLANALDSFKSGVGVEIPMNEFNFIITTNKHLANSKESNKSQKLMDEFAIRDRVSYRPLKISDKNDAWGWVAQVVLDNDIFKADGFSLNDDQTRFLLEQFYNNWDFLLSNSIRAVKEAGAILYNRPKTFVAEFNQTFVE